MWKQTVCAALFAAALPLAASAAVVSQTDMVGNTTMKLTYPVVHLENGAVQSAINADIQRYVHDALQQYDKGGASYIATSYTIPYEDSQYLSLILETYIYTNGAHGQPYYHGLVYAKQTGQRLPLRYFLSPLSIQDIRSGIMDNRLYLAGADAKKLAYDPQFTPKTVSQEYYLMGNGYIGILFQPYEFGPYSSGPIAVIFSRDAASYYNQRHESANGKSYPSAQS